MKTHAFFPFKFHSNKKTLTREKQPFFSQPFPEIIMNTFWKQIFVLSNHQRTVQSNSAIILTGCGEWITGIYRVHLQLSFFVNCNWLKKTVEISTHTLLTTETSSFLCSWHLEWIYYFITVRHLSCWRKTLERLTSGDTWVSGVVDVWVVLLFLGAWFSFETHLHIGVGLAEYILYNYSV